MKQNSIEIKQYYILKYILKRKVFSLSFLKSWFLILKGMTNQAWIVTIV